MKDKEALTLGGRGKSIPGKCKGRAVGVSVVLSGNLKDNVFDLEDKGKRMCVIKP